MNKWDVRHGHRKATQKAVKGGAIIIGEGTVLSDAAEVVMRQLEERLYMLTKDLKLTFLSIVFAFLHYITNIKF